MKFLLDETRARDVEAFLAEEMTADPHGDPQRGGSYEVASVYCDSRRHDSFHGAGAVGRCRLRARRYGGTSPIFLERKATRGLRVAKRRAVIAPGEIDRLNGAPPDDAWAGHWFRRHLAHRGLRPVCKVSYSRRAWFAADAQGPVRVTLDRDVAGSPASDWNVDWSAAESPLLEGKVVLELKYRGPLPARLKRIVERFRLEPCGVSKFRLAMRACGLVPGQRPSDA